MNIYFISIGGVASGNLAVLLKDKGHNVYGSEFSKNVFYPPISTILKQKEINVDFGFDPDIIDERWDLIIVGGGALIHDPQNPQVKKAKKLKLKVISVPETIGEFICAENNIEVVGNHGKTTTSAIIAQCLLEIDQDSSYFIGGEVKGLEKTIKSGDGEWSVCEGDEHPTLGYQKGGKFLYHKVKHLLVSSVDWDHKNVFKTESEYIANYGKLISKLDEDSVISACLDGQNVLKTLGKYFKKGRINFYTLLDYKLLKPGVDPLSITEDNLNETLSKYISEVKENKLIHKNLENIYYIKSVNFKWNSSYTRFGVIKYNFINDSYQNIGAFTTTQIGHIGVENSLAAISILDSLGLDTEKISLGVNKFQGVSRKLELVYDYDHKVINDHAHSPIKIKSSLEALRLNYTRNNIFVILHIHQSGLKERKTFRQLKYVFNLADYVLITKFNPDLRQKNPLFAKDYRDLIKEGALKAGYLKPENVYYCPIVTQLKSILQQKVRKDDVIVIMSTGDATEFIDTAKQIVV